MEFFRDMRRRGAGLLFRADEGTSRKASVGETVEEHIAARVPIWAALAEWAY